MSWTFDNNKPIYLQIMDKIKLQIVSHKLEPNQQLPTVRELASEAGVNPNTIQRALSDLEREGFVYTKRTAGRFVTEDLELILQSRKQLSEEQLQQLITASVQAESPMLGQCRRAAVDRQKAGRGRDQSYRPRDSKPYL